MISERPIDSEFYVQLARTIDSVFRLGYKKSAFSTIKKYRKEHPECTIPPTTIEWLCRRDFNHIRRYPSMQMLDAICRMAGFSVLDVVSFSNKVHKHVKQGPKKGGPPFKEVYDWEEFDKRFQ